MNLLQFLFGENFKNRSISFKPGTFYLDTSSNELWIDDPSNLNKTHTKIIDTDTLIFSTTGDPNQDYPKDNNNDTAELGIAKLSYMILREQEDE